MERRRVQTYVMKSIKNTQTLAVGWGAGFSGDRVDAPGPVVRTLIEPE